MPLRRDHRRPEADVQRLRDLEERRREVRALPHHQRRRRHVRALHEDLPVEPGRPVRRERFPLAGDERPRQRARAGRAGRQARPRHDQPGEEVVVGHRARPQHRPLCARRADAHARPAEGPGVEARGADAGGVSRRRHAAALPRALSGESRRRHPPLPRAVDARAVPRAAGGRRHRRPGAADPAARRRAAGVPGAPGEARGDGQRRGEVRVQARPTAAHCRASRPARTSTSSSRPSTSAPTAWPATRPTRSAMCWACSTRRPGAAARR